MKRFSLLLTLCLVFSGASLWGQRTVTGTVTDTEGEPLIGVNIVEQGTINGTITDFNGGYSLEVAGPESVLVFTYTGYERMTAEVGAQNNIDVSMEESVELLDEVVVSALGFVQKKDEVGSTYSTVSNEDVIRSGEVTVLNGLAAKASNVQISRTNGDPGAGTTIRIRGANTIS